MAINLEELSAHLSSEELQHERLVEDGQEALKLLFHMNSYLSCAGSHELHIYITLEEQGRYLKVFSPRVYQVNEAHRRNVFVALLHVSWLTQLIQWEFDIEDGEVRVIVEFPIEDGTITARQLCRVVRDMVGIVDKYDTTIRTAMETGKLKLPPETPAPKSFGSTMNLFSLAMAHPEHVDKMIEEARREGRITGSFNREDDPN